MKIAIISDIHANLPALKAVLEDISLFNPDQIYCLGDLTDAAPWHNEVIELIQERNIPTIMGNHDERIAFDHPVHPLKKHSLAEQQARLAAIEYTKKDIIPANKAFLSGLPASLKIEMDGIRILLVHGSPDSNEEYLYEDAEESKLSEMFAQQQVEVIISGHTHLSYIRYLRGSTPQQPRLMINAGAVGRSKENDRKAAYLQLEVIAGASLPAELKAVIRKVAYPIEETMMGIRSNPIPDFYAEFFEKEHA
ncbi:metallophosphoesterase family protein [Pedobacter sp. N36a]|uniref:metallophosphoesterase family protein n=1 Tax=Pedobacter sp. N36a TaxID=2767996 RepID=UPI001656B6F0|nr:metallophosphoesterase family protein [Pedobacter sp. N36a]MBC8984176.1 metallophosphoesterase family protein [Pedobacter sp. N36a]